MRFTNVYAGWPSSVHDARIFRNSTLYNRCEPNYNYLFPEETYLVGDKAYPLKMWLMTPYRSERQLLPREVAFNKKLSATRSVIERSFALLKGRFRRLKYLDMDVKYISATIVACCVLHNICLNEDNADFVLEGEQINIDLDANANNDSLRSPYSDNELSATQKRNTISNQ